MDYKNENTSFFTNCYHDVKLELSKSQDIIFGSSEIVLENNIEFPNKLFLQTPSFSFCRITSVEINGVETKAWSVSPFPSIENSNKIVGNNVFDIATLQMAYGFISSSYGEMNPDNSNANENRLFVSISDEARFKTRIDNQGIYILVVKTHFELELKSTRSPITYVIENDGSIDISIVPNELSKSPWFPTLSSKFYLGEEVSPFWNSPWKFTCIVPDEYTAIMPGMLKSKTRNRNYIESGYKTNTFEYHYDSGNSFPHLYPNNVSLFIGKYSKDSITFGKNRILIFKPLINSQILNIDNVISEIIDGYENILNCDLPMKSISIILSNFHNGIHCSKFILGPRGVSYSLGNQDMLSRISSPLLYQETNYHAHINESDIGRTIGNIVLIPFKYFVVHELSNLICNSNKQKCMHDFQENINFHIKNLTTPVLILLDRLASLWFGSFIHIVNWKRLPTDNWLLFGMKRYLIRQLAKRLCGEDLVKCRMKEATERCIQLIENGNDYIPLSIKDFYLPLQPNSAQSCPIIHWGHVESQTIFRLKSDIVFHSLKCFINEMIKNKARKVGFGFSESETFKQITTEPKLFNTFIQSFITRHCIKKNHRNFTTQHFFTHLASSISQQFIHRSKKEIATAQLPQHEQYLLNEIQEELVAFKSAWIEGVGCPNLTVSSTIQLSNSNTSFENITFTVDQTPLQPPHLISKEGISSFIPIVSVFRVNISDQKHQIDQLVTNYISYLSGLRRETTPNCIPSNSIASIIPPFLWPHDPNNIVLKESSVTILGLGHTGRISVPLKHGIGPLFDSLRNQEIENANLNKCMMNCTSFEKNLLDSSSQKSKLLTVSNKKYSFSSNGSYSSWQFGYMNILCQIISESYKNFQKSEMRIDWLCTEISSNIPISGGSGKFWPGHISINLVQTEENKKCELEIIEPQLPVSQELKFDTQKKSGFKRESVSGSNTSSSSVCIQGLPNNSNATKHTRISEVPRLSLLYELQQRKHFVGKISNSDDIWLKPLKISDNTIKVNPQKNESLVFNERANSIQLNVHLLWLFVDASQYWLAKISRYQTWSMWDQQFLNETNVIGQLEAATQLGMERYIFVRCITLIGIYMFERKP
ncbi:bromodomain-containing protein [Cryptosporidium felis]|nr:bromodomain-containing protein [Cryptosporidium felis]